MDEVYVEIAKSMKQILKGVEIRVFQTDVPERIQQVLNLPGGAAVLLFAEPVNYVKYRLFQYLDFSNGEP